MNFSLKQIAVFDAIAQYGSVSQAAQSMMMTQSAASMALAQLEQQLGHPLFERTGRRLFLNSWGYWLQPRAKQLLQDAIQIEQGLNGRHPLSGELRLGISQTIAEVLLSRLVCDLDQLHPQLRLLATVSNTQQVVERLLEHQLELGIIEGRSDESRLNSRYWCDDELMIVCGATHPLAAYEHVKIEQLSGVRWVLRERGSGTRDTFINAIYPHLGELDIWREFTHVPTIMALLAQSDYVGCLPERVIRGQVQAGQLKVLNVQGLSIIRQFHFIWRKGAGSDPLRDCVIEQAMSLV